MPFFGRDECERDPFSAHPSGPAHSVDVVIAKLRRVEIDDVRNTRDINSSSDDVGSDQKTQFSFAETTHHSVPSTLREVPVNAIRSGGPFGQPVGNPLRTAFCAAEDNCLTRFFSNHKSYKQFEFALSQYGEIPLFNRFDGDVRGREIDRLRR